ncbi:hypothetical protein BKA66DRAFT_571611 [Pyrenochaeta sp. MPI-SDFR-AT-0127]|nr:hypothetical protein BKA66DRAFT_571611 [Pyrenochaeta sp. MPI-SDFR-AT-0127]
MANIHEDHSNQFQEPISPTSTQDDTHKSTTAKIADKVKAPFHKEKEIPPDLQAAIGVMEERKAETARKMEASGKDPSVLSGKRIDVVKK